MALKKGTKTILVWIIGIAVAFFVYMKFFQKDKMGGKMTVDSNGIPFYNGVATPGKIEGMVRVVNGYWTGKGTDGAQWAYKENGWVRLG